MTALRIDRLHHRAHDTAAAIHAVQQLAYAQEAALLGAHHFPPLARRIDDIQREAVLFYGALVGGEIVGALGIEPEGDGADHLCMTSLVVAPQRQRLGIASRLVAAVLADHDQAGWSVSTGAENAPALALYARFGFVLQATRTVGAERLKLVTLRRSRGQGRERFEADTPFRRDTPWPPTPL